MKTNFAIRIKSKDDYFFIMERMTQLEYTEDLEWNNRKLKKDFTNGYFLVSDQNDKELSLFAYVLEDEIPVYDSYEEFKKVYDENQQSTTPNPGI